MESDDFTFVPLKFEPYNFESSYFYFYKLVDNKFVQLTSSEEYEENKYYIPQFSFINQVDDYYVLMTDENEPTISYEDGDGEEVTISDFRENYFNYYTLVDGIYRNLQEPVEYQPNTYYKLASTNVKAIANDVVSYTYIPITSVYVSTLAEIQS